jgi:hypothetical protein
MQRKLSVETQIVFKVHIFISVRTHPQMLTRQFPETLVSEKGE